MAHDSRDFMVGVNSKLFCLASSVFLSAVVACSACSSSSNNGGSGGGGSSQAGASAQGGAGAQAGTASQAGATAQAGTSAQAGGTSNAGAGGATPGGAGGSAGAVAQGGGAPDKCSTALLCDDFEKYDLAKPPGAPWTNNTSGGTVTIDGTHVHSGTHAVKLSAASATGYRSAMINLQKTTFLPTANNVFYGRMMFWLDSAPQTSVHWTFIDAQGLVPNQAYHAIYRYGGQMPLADGSTPSSQLMANYDTPDSYATPKVGPSTDCWVQSDAVPVPVGAWACAEWKFDGQGNKMQFWLNGTEVPSLEMNGMGQGCVNQTDPYTWAAPSFDRIDLGWESYQADDARNLWLDDVAIGTERMGCPQ